MSISAPVLCSVDDGEIEAAPVVSLQSRGWGSLAVEIDACEVFERFVGGACGPPGAEFDLAGAIETLTFLGTETDLLGAVETFFSGREG